MWRNVRGRLLWTCESVGQMERPLDKGGESGRGPLTTGTGPGLCPLPAVEMPSAVRWAHWSFRCGAISAFA